MSADEFLPAVGQGAIGIEARADDARTRDCWRASITPTPSTAVACERAFLAVLDGSCKTPIAGHATIAGDAVQFRGLIARPDGSAAHDIARQRPRARRGSDRRRCRPRARSIAPARISSTRLTHARRRHPPATRRRAHRRALRARGHEVLVAPLMRVEPVAADLSGDWGAVIITSANAATAPSPAIRRASALIALPLFAVGQRSAEAARAAGFTDVTSAGGDVRDLVRTARARSVPTTSAAALSRRRGPRRRSRRRARRARHRRRDARRLSRRHRAVSAELIAALKAGDGRRRAAFFAAQRRELPRRRQ